MHERAGRADIVVAALVCSVLLLPISCTGGGSRGSPSSRSPEASKGPGYSAPNSAQTQDDGALAQAGAKDAYRVPESLRRPLQRISMPRGRCVITQPIHRVSPDYGLAQGPGPVYPVSDGGVLRVEFPPDPNSIYAGTGYSAAKVIWIAEPSYDGPVLVRSFQVKRATPSSLHYGVLAGRPALGSEGLLEGDVGPAEHAGVWPPREWVAGARYVVS